METDASVALGKTYRTTVIIGAAIMATLFVYAGIVEVINAQNSWSREYAPAPDVVALLRYVFLCVTVVDFFVIQFLKKRMLSPDVPVQPTSVTGPSAAEARKLMTASIVSFALCESVAIYGLVLFVIGRNTSDFYLFLLISVFYFGVFFPRYGTWEEWMQERERAARRVRPD